MTSRDPQATPPMLAPPRAESAIPGTPPIPPDPGHSTSSAPAEAKEEAPAPTRMAATVGTQDAPAYAIVADAGKRPPVAAAGEGCSATLERAAAGSVSHRDGRYAAKRWRVPTRYVTRCRLVVRNNSQAAIPSENVWVSHKLREGMAYIFGSAIAYVDGPQRGRCHVPDDLMELFLNDGVRMLMSDIPGVRSDLPAGSALYIAFDMAATSLRQEAERPIEAAGLVRLPAVMESVLGFGAGACGAGAMMCAACSIRGLLLGALVLGAWVPAYLLGTDVWDAQPPESVTSSRLRAAGIALVGAVLGLIALVVAWVTHGSAAK
jgi:hypothetical protein